jgi:glutamyl-tRNA synthetase
LPDALTNYLVRLGWSYGDQEVFSMEELIRFFSFENVGKSSAVFNQEKLLWLNGQYMMRTEPSELTELVIPFLVREGLITEGQEIDRSWLSKAVVTLQERAKTLKELAHALRYYLVEELEYSEKARAKFLTWESLPYLKDLKEHLALLTDFSAGEIEKVFRSIIERYGIKLASLAQPVRVAITGGTESPGIFEVLEIVGKEKTLRRIERAILVIDGGTA